MKKIWLLFSEKINLLNLNLNNKKLTQLIILIIIFSMIVTTTIIPSKAGYVESPDLKVTKTPNKKTQIAQERNPEKTPKKKPDNNPDEGDPFKLTPVRCLKNFQALDIWGKICSPTPERVKPESPRKPSDCECMFGYNDNGICKDFLADPPPSKKEIEKWQKQCKAKTPESHDENPPIDVSNEPEVVEPGGGSPIPPSSGDGYSQPGEISPIPPSSGDGYTQPGGVSPIPPSSGDGYTQPNFSDITPVIDPGKLPPLDNTTKTTLDYYLEFVTVAPINPKEMEPSTVTIGFGVKGEYPPDMKQRLEFIFTQKNIETGEYWKKSYFYDKDIGNGNLEIKSFLFYHPGKFILEVELVPLSVVDNNPANNRLDSREIEVIANPTKLSSCEKLLVDVLVMAMETLVAPGSGAIAEDTFERVELIKNTVMIYSLEANCSSKVMQDKCVKELRVTIFFKVLNEVAKRYFKDISFDKFIQKYGGTILTHFITGLYHAWDCGWNLGDLLIQIVEDSKSKGYDINGILVESPIDVFITTSSGQRVGIKDGAILEEIEGSSVLITSEGKKMVAYPGKDTKTVEFTGTGEGSFDVAVALSNSGSKAGKYQGEIHSGSKGDLDLSGEKMTLNLDDNGDGIVDRRIEPQLPEGEGKNISTTRRSTSRTSGGAGFLVIFGAMLAGGGIIFAALRRKRRPALSSPASLNALLCSESGKTINLIQERFLIGRGSACDLILKDKKVSRRHALILREAEGWQILDQNSDAGTYVNGQRVMSATLKNGDQISIASFEYTFYER